MGEYLQLSPPELKFRFELRKNIPVTLSLHNPGTERVAFKVKTTSPKKYCVRPSSGYVEPGTTKDVQVIMQAQREYPSSYNDCKDKFKVESIKISSDVSDITPELFEPGSGKEIKQSKLRVVFVGPPKPPSPVPEGIEEEASPVKSAFAKENGPEPGATPAAAAAGRAGVPPAAPAAGGDSDPNSELQKVTRDRNRLREQLAKSEADKAELKKRLDLVSSGGGNAALQQRPSSGLSLLHLLVAALVAFLAGYLLKR